MSRIQVCGVILLRSDGAALLQLRDNKADIDDPGLWVFPGGHCEPDEDPEACAGRELFEETLYRCPQLHYLARYTGSELGYRRDFDLRFYWGFYDEVQSYECREGQDLRFVTPEEAELLPMPSYLGHVWNLAIGEAKIHA